MPNKLHFNYKFWELLEEDLMYKKQFHASFTFHCSLCSREISLDAPIYFMGKKKIDIHCMNDFKSWVKNKGKYDN